MLVKNQPAPAIKADSITGQTIDLSGLRGKKVLIKFHRFSGCPIAQCQINDLITRHDELNSAGIETIVFLHSSKEKIVSNSNFKETPGLHIIADREKRFYRLYQSQFPLKKFFSIASWRETFRSVFKGYLPKFNQFQGGILGVPSDFLLNKNGIIADLNYGSHFGDSWSVSEVISKGSKLKD